MDGVTRRYSIRREDSGLWTVFDVFTGQPAVCEERTTVDLDADDARDITDLLNSADIERRSSI